MRIRRWRRRRRPRQNSSSGRQSSVRPMSRFGRNKMANSVHSAIDQVLIPEDRIAQRVRELALKIMEDHSAAGLDDAEITIVPVMTGAMIFASDLIRKIPMAMKIGLMTVSSYPGSSIQSRGSQMIARQVGNVEGRSVLG